MLKDLAKKNKETVVYGMVDKLYKLSSAVSKLLYFNKSGVLI